MPDDSTPQTPQALIDAWRQKAEGFMAVGDYPGAKQLRKCADELEEAIDDD